MLTRSCAVCVTILVLEKNSNWVWISCSYTHSYFSCPFLYALGYNDCQFLPRDWLSRLIFDVLYCESISLPECPCAPVTITFHPQGGFLWVSLHHLLEALVHRCWWNGSWTRKGGLERGRGRWMKLQSHKKKTCKQLIPDRFSPPTQPEN